MLAAARRNDFHACPAHPGGDICAPFTSEVETNGFPQARAGDPALCGGPVDFLVTGSGTVTVRSKPAARVTDKSMHKGAVMVGSLNVKIGGPTVGVMLGDPDAAEQDCAALAATRHTPGQTRQSYGNCGIEASRAAINRARAARGLPPMTEDEALQRGIALGVAGHDPAKPWALGATDANGRVKLLKDQGVDASTEPGTPENIAQRVAEGRGVSASVYPYWYWPAWAHSKLDAQHEIGITGVEFDENGNVKAYIVTDSALGDCHLRIDAATWAYTHIPNTSITVTNHAIR
jgi:uncharacterized Zn-binding protein involved in type VI secretion